MQIQKSFKEEKESGVLYLVPTPIGNLEDMTFRAVNVLKEVDIICAEDTRNTGLLLKHFGIKTKQVSFHEHNAYDKIPDLLDLLLAGRSLAQVSDAGMPSISDPGHELVRAAIDRDITVVALPGASAGITGLIASGLAPQPHLFYGFLPRKAGQQRAFLMTKADYPETQIFYESPYRVKDTLTNLLACYGDRQVVLVRELTKLFEEYQRGQISEVLTYLADHPIKGECLLIVAGANQTDASEPAEDLDLLALVQEAIAAGMKPNQAIKAVAKDYKVNRQELYQQFHGLG
ncbi:tetrapyrrole methylase [Streptococcus equi subsp. zooepidemicus Sz105]|uniref:16S rRNA (cytidine(1402)-2'-O)-methyltransferase n=1 Tax=Streptococcus equi TaxID=1336 RepID=UPI0005B8A400|nr:16S rRNA (cytidine(1402)-2'-O)-methyltransferase [Streptococcus equi]KIS11812.1 tetrapyrrole methylase [Streptococcus equi subsp. zooepidemicus Sz105]MDI5989139.1 16S rRNA (cytidine(1402)-2'-O)-methyltransferase [Streptococcus equi subsp. zooepidemicus]HEL0559144.1 16S rRNA (cytidine(1402)-2'-O)-methyltransferase [Streptococcus equi subsp. zooepidemicus]HEL0585531.1 16S rRNA (cytidine(1402)-2'-O)-methyltransferase [Streptococcus equi subsp. zooepidemicus]HEL0608442.1 16S rRNA (cytidine(1402